MKQVIKPYQPEEAVYYSDFTGKCFGKFPPSVLLSFHFDYGSTYDGACLDFDLSDEEAKSVLEFIKSKLSKDFKENLKKKIEKQNVNFTEAADAKDYTESESSSSLCALYNILLN